MRVRVLRQGQAHQLAGLPPGSGDPHRVAGRVVELVGGDGLARGPDPNEETGGCDWLGTPLRRKLVVAAPYRHDNRCEGEKTLDPGHDVELLGRKRDTAPRPFGR